MSVSSVSTSVPPQPALPANQNQPNPPDNNNDNNSDNNNVGAAQGASQGQAPLPPGQGTRINQLV
jgi:hypothetical protein